MVHDLANDGGFAALKQAAEDREGWMERERERKNVKNLLYSRRLLMMMICTGIGQSSKFNGGDCLAEGQGSDVATE